jgi:hypothetical protein
LFTASTSLGGHVSKKHPGKSEGYQQKQVKRAKNETDREMRKKAKEFFFQQTKKDPAAFRQKITSIKKVFLALDSESNVDRQKLLKNELKSIIQSVISIKSVRY